MPKDQPKRRGSDSSAGSNSKPAFCPLPPAATTSRNWEWPRPAIPRQQERGHAQDPCPGGLWPARRQRRGDVARFTGALIANIGSYLGLPLARCCASARNSRRQIPNARSVISVRLSSLPWTVPLPASQPATCGTGEGHGPAPVSFGVAVSTRRSRRSILAFIFGVCNNGIDYFQGHAADVVRLLAGMHLGRRLGVPFHG